jgi:hypothetical protein
MLEAARSRERRQAAEALKAHQPAHDVPAYAIAAADLELARNCRDRERAIKAIVELGDVRARPPLRRIHDAPRRGCGFFNREDCYACVRLQVEDALTALGGASDVN